MCAKQLDTAINNQITAKVLKPVYSLTVHGNDVTDYLIDFTVNFDKQFGAATATFTLLNNAGEFGDAGASHIYVGDIVVFNQSYSGSSITWNTFYGFVQSREMNKDATTRNIVLTCLDYLAQLKMWDIDLKVEAPKTLVSNEILKPNYLPSPNQMYSQVFNFANEDIAQLPPPVLTVQLQNPNSDSTVEDASKYNGFNFDYSTGQVQLGTPFNVLNNYNVIAKSYYFYPTGLYIEDILKTIITQPNAYNEFLFGESSANNVIANHLTTDHYTQEGSNTDTLIPNLTPTTITIHSLLAQNYKAGDLSGYDSTKLYLVSTAGLPNSGTGTVNGESFTWTGIASGNVLTGVSATLSNHDTTSIMNYTATYQAGRVWYLKYTNVSTALTSGNFTIPSGAYISYFDARYGRIILNTPITITDVVTCNVNYTFCTLQATGIQINYISLMSRDIDNALDGIKNLLTYVAPNYIVRTNGDALIWSSYLSQNTVADYPLVLMQDLKYVEDTDIYTHTIFYGNNKNPTDILFNPGVSIVSTGQSFTGCAIQTELVYNCTNNGWHQFITSIGDAGYILGNPTPIMYINGVQVNGLPFLEVRQPVTIDKTTTTTTSGGGGLCIVTEATCKFLEKSDNCYELRTLRMFRDDWLAKQSNGPLLIENYYTMTPNIVKQINASFKKNKIYAIIWDEYIRKCVELIEKEQYEETKKLYIKGITQLLDLDEFLKVHGE